MESPAPEPSPRDVLRWCSDAGPGAWFPSAHAAAAGLPRDRLDEPLWRLREAGLVRVADWVKGRGQGFCLTDAGTNALESADPLATAPAPPPAAAPAPPPAAPARPAPTSAVPVLLFLNGAWFLAGLLAATRSGLPAGQYLGGSASAEMLDLAIRLGAAYAPAIAGGEWWRLGSSLFVHFGLLHLASNMVALATLGADAERCFGARRFLLIYFAAGLGGNCFAVGAYPSPNSVLAGASGAVWGAMVALLVWLLQFRDRLPRDLVGRWIRVIFLILLANAAFSAVPGVSWQAHFGGGVTGGALAALAGLEMRRPNSRRRRTLLRLAASAVVAAGPTLLMWQAARSESWKVLRAVNRPPAPPTALADRPIDIPGDSPLIEALNAVGPGRARAAQMAVTVALVARGPNSTAEARAAVAGLRTGLDRAERLPPVSSLPGLPAYLAAVRQLADELQSLLAAGRVPSAGGWDEVERRGNAVEARWRALAAPAAP